MLKRRKKFISKLLVLSMCTSFVPVTITFADQTSGQVVNQSATAESDFTFDASTGTIKKYIGNSSTIDIPSTINGVPVKTIGNSAFYQCISITKITIPNSVTNIGEDAFEGCSSLANITISDNVTSIGKAAFKNCSSLTSFTIPKSVTSITDSTFESCSSLTNITIPKGVITIGNNAFYNCPSLTSITIPDSVTSIGVNVFYDCTGLESIIVDDNNGNYISEDGVLFNKSKSNLIKYPEGKKDKNYIIPAEVLCLGDYAFYNSFNLSSVIIPNGVTSIGCNAFENCSNLTNVVMPNSITSMESYAFKECKSLKSINISNKISRIEYQAFYDCKSLINITIPSSVTSIGREAFINCSGITSIDIPKGVITIEEAAFEHCSGMLSLNISDSVTSIGDSAFLDCSSLTTLTIPKSVTNIGYWAFYFGYGLKKVIIPDSVTIINTQAFDNAQTAFYVESVKTKNLLMRIGIKESKIVLNGQIPVKVTNLSLSRSNFSCRVGDHKTITADITPNDATNQNLLWSSSDNNVATVTTGGAVTAVGVGNATLTCTVEDDSTISASCNITVTTSSAVKVTSMSIDTTKSSWTVGEQGTFTATFTPSNATDKTVTWTSSDQNIATVNSNGVVTAKAKGVVTITATSNSDSSVKGSKTITITGQDDTAQTGTKVSSIAVYGAGNITTKGGTTRLTTDVLPVKAANKTVTWTSGNPSIATVDSQGIVTAVSNGVVTIKATATDGSQVSGSKVIVITGQGAAPTSNTGNSNSVLKSVSISGTEEVGHKLKAKVKYDGTEPSVKYQWQKASKKDGDYSDIDGADEEEYKLRSSDDNKYIKVIVTATINGTNYNVEDTTGKIDKNTSKDDDSDDSSDSSPSSSSSSNSSSGRNTYEENISNIGVLRASTPTSTTTDNALKPSKPLLLASNLNSNSGLSANTSFRNPSGHAVSGWASSGDKWYFLDNNGVPKLGWVSYAGKWYYLSPGSDANQGTMKTGWIQYNGNWYYLDESGAMVCNATVDGYRLGEDGAMI